MPGLDQLIGSTYGPFPVDTAAGRAAAFVEAIGDDPSAWDGRLHPMFANAALFAAAPVFLEASDVVPFTRSLLHSEQAFEWHGDLAAGTELQVTGTVDGVRGRGALNLVTFRMAAESDRGLWATGSSVFLMSDEAAGTGDDASEPDEDERPPVDPPGGSLDVPEQGGPIVPMACGASRTDLMRYAAASGDWNPIHFDHDSARAAGLEGVIVHGLLMAAWVGRAAGRYGSLHSMRIRFRNPLRPAVPATVSGTVAGITPGSVELDLDLSAGEQRLVTARAAVTR